MRRALFLLRSLAAECSSATGHALVTAPPTAGLPQRALAQLTSLLAQQMEPRAQQAAEQPAAAEVPAPPAASRPPWEKRKRGGRKDAAAATAALPSTSQPKPPRRRKPKAAAADARSAATAAAARPPLSAAATAAADGKPAAWSDTAEAQQQQAQKAQEGQVVLQDDAHPIREADLSPAAWHVLGRLRGVGHQVFVVGGTVRDILLRGTPKDYDVLTSADPHQVKKLFSRCFIVGRSFPVAHVHVEGEVIEVTSFSTNADSSLIPADAASYLEGSGGGGGLRRAGGKSSSATWAGTLAVNAVHRDFTVNGLLYDPFSRSLLDYVGGVADCRQRLLRTISDPEASFREDPARILRGIRLASRAGLRVGRDTAAAMGDLSPLVAGLPAGRLQMELGALMAYGASAGSVRLMWRFGVLDLLLAHHAVHLKQQHIARNPRHPKPSLLFDLLAALDGSEGVSPQQPVDPSAWIALLAAPLVAEECARICSRAKAARQRQPLATFSASNYSAPPPRGDPDWEDVNEYRRARIRQIRGSVGFRELGAAGLAEGGGESGSSSSSSSSGGGSEDSESKSSDEGGRGSSSSGSEGDSGEDERGRAAEGETQSRDTAAGAAGALPAELGPGAPQAAARQAQQAQRQPVGDAYLQQYSQVVADVLERMALPPDPQALQALAQQAHPGGAAPAEGLRRKRRRRRSQAVAADPPLALPPRALVASSLLPSSSVQRAAAMLVLEARMRGRALPGEGEPRPPRHRGHARWRLRPEERLVLGVLREARFDWALRTQLPPPSASHR